MDIVIIVCLITIYLLLYNELAATPQMPLGALEEGGVEFQNLFF